MKRLLLLFVMSAIWGHQLFASEYSAVTKSFTMTVGKKKIINPFSDSNVLSVDCTSCGSTLEISDASAFTYTKSQAFGGGYTFELTALKAGTYSVVNYIGYSTKVWGGFSYYTLTGSVKVTYNITVYNVTSISIPSAISVVIGKTYTFSPKITDSRAETTLTWKSSNTSVATITSAGVLTAKGVGTATITCTASNGVSAKCVVTVTPILATKVTLNYTSYQLEKNGKIKLVATVTPSNATNKKVTWKSSNASIA
ncbi:MAG: Ig-like domain-containing protein, partial [Bacteroidaceae bacterium]|nr:Ig-like domain-containing protein [Bacteroidaceae bacterium]